MLKELMQEYGDRVAFKRMHMPLEMHALAADAARVAVCAAKQGQEAAMADLLFEGKLDDESYAAYAAELKLDAKLFDACRADPATQAAIDSDIARFRESGLHGLPTTYIGDERITGARPMATFKEAFERAATAHAGLQPSGGLFLTFSVLIVAGLLGAGHLAQRRSAS
jgi:protein-disulfide isomerase